MWVRGTVCVGCVCVVFEVVWGGVCVLFEGCVFELCVVFEVCVCGVSGVCACVCG